MRHKGWHHSGNFPQAQHREANSILTSFNRNFPARNDANPGTLAFIGSPEVVIAYTLAGTLAFDPQKDELTGADGTKFKLKAPAPAPEIPSRGFVMSFEGYQAPPATRSGVAVAVAKDSERLALLEPFAPWDGKDLVDMPVLMKAKGKSTTDHISAAGKWLTYRGHLENISGNLFLSAVNAYNGAVGEAKSVIDGSTAT